MELERARAKGKRSQPVFFLGRPERCRATRKKKRFGGVSRGRWWRAHYACLEVEVREKRSKRAKPCQNACWWVERRGGERERVGEALPNWETMQAERGEKVRVRRQKRRTNWRGRTSKEGQSNDEQADTQGSHARARWSCGLSGTRGVIPKSCKERRRATGTSSRSTDDVRRICVGWWGRGDSVEGVVS